MSKVKAKRTQVGIISEILELCRKSAAKTKIMQKANMSFAQTQKLLEHLQKLELLELDEDNKKLKTTEKGFAFLKKHSELQKLLKP
jgi:predicted transcriptional regulator